MSGWSCQYKSKLSQSLYHKVANRCLELFAGNGLEGLDDRLGKSLCDENLNLDPIQ